jgi:hypothetical protein
LTISSSLPLTAQLSITQCPGGIVCINGGQSTPVARFGLQVGIPLVFPGQRWTMIPPAGGTAAIVPTLQTGIWEAHGTPKVRSA